MCFGVHLKAENLPVRPKDDPRYFDMCVYKRKKNNIDHEDYWNEENKPPYIGGDFNNLEISNWKKKKCDHCNRLYCAVIVLSLLTNGRVFIKNLGDILGKIHRPSIANGRGINEIFDWAQMEYLFNFGNRSFVSKFVSQEYLPWTNGELQKRNQCQLQINEIWKFIIHDRKLT